MTNEWRSAEDIVMQIDLQNSNNRKNTIAKLFNLAVETNQSSIETTFTSIKNALASIPEKMAFTHQQPNIERKDSITSNEVFFEVKITFE